MLTNETTDKPPILPCGMGLRKSSAPLERALADATGISVRGFRVSNLMQRARKRTSGQGMRSA
jgi:hypothetical protein